jgi:hypothetical protein
MTKRDGLPTGAGTSPDRDVSDPHPANEEKYDRQKSPGGMRSAKKGLGPNDAIHTGRPRPKRAVAADHVMSGSADDVVPAQDTARVHSVSSLKGCR